MFLNIIYKSFVATNNIYNSFTHSQTYNTHHAQTYSINSYKGKVTLAAFLVQKDQLSVAQLSVSVNFKPSRFSVGQNGKFALT